ncbi:MAG: molybdenum cofactor guanylyltransferase [Bryobacteraceae bacterium]
MGRAGFVLAGGKSSRMGSDKALLPFRGAALACHVASAVQTAAGSVALIGDPQKYAHLGFPVFPDLSPGAGPLGGIASALTYTAADWNLLVACDMPAITPELMADLLHLAESSHADALVPAGPSGRLEPLCAVYHRRCLAALEQALASGVRKVTAALAGLDLHIRQMENPSCFENLNTPEDWACYHDAH